MGGSGLDEPGDVSVKNSPFGNFLNADFASNFLGSNLPRLGLADFRLSNCKIVPLKLSKTGGKSVVEFKLTLSPENGGREVSRSIIGIWRPDSRNEKVFGLLRKLRKRGFDGNNHFQVCEPLAYFRDWNLLLTSRASGVELEHMLAVGDRDLLASSVSNAARWLSRLHTSRLSSEKRSSVEEEDRTLRNWLTHLKRLYPDSTRRLHDLVRRIIEMEESFNHRRFVLIHGDFHPENIFVNNSTVTATDFERSCVFDPAKDVGYFVAQFGMKAQKGKYPSASKNGGLGLRELFLREYSENSSTDVLERVPTYEARTYLEILHYIYWGLGVKRDPADFESWITRAEENVGT